MGSRSDFTMNRMPTDKIVKRSLHSWSVHHSLTTNKWIATLARPLECGTATGGNHGNVTAGNHKMTHVQFVFGTEREARKFCQAYAPPKMADREFCQGCRTVGSFRHCRNCGVNVCDACTTRWGMRMVPKTFMVSPTVWVRVCQACDWLSNAFCMALLQGRYQDAIRIHATGNVNLRASFAGIRGEAMFPVHVAVIGGSMDILRWMVDGQMCPISVKSDPKTNQALSVQTSAGRTLLDLAMTGKPKYDILKYLLAKGLSILDVKNPMLAPRVLESLMKTDGGAAVGLFKSSSATTAVVEVESINESVHSIDDACHICFERSMDCVFTPCGHQLCCSDCAEQVSSCPICKTKGSFLRVFRQ